MLGTKPGCAGAVPRGVCCCVTAMRACLRPSELILWGEPPPAWWRWAELDLPCTSCAGTFHQTCQECPYITKCCFLHLLRSQPSHYNQQLALKALASWLGHFCCWDLAEGPATATQITCSCCWGCCCLADGRCSRAVPLSRMGC